MTNIQTVDEFLSGDTFCALCSEGVQDENGDAMELIKMIDMNVESLAFFTKIDNQSRFKREMNQLITTINYIKEIYEHK